MECSCKHVIRLRSSRLLSKVYIKHRYLFYLISPTLNYKQSSLPTLESWTTNNLHYPSSKVTNMSNTKTHLICSLDKKSRGRPFKIRSGLRGRPKKLPAKTPLCPVDLPRNLLECNANLREHLITIKTRKSPSGKYHTCFYT